MKTNHTHQDFHRNLSFFIIPKGLIIWYSGALTQYLALEGLNETRQGLEEDLQNFQCMFFYFSLPLGIQIKSYFVIKAYTINALTLG